MNSLDIEKLVDMIVGFVLGVVVTIAFVLAIGYFNPTPQCTPTVAYTLHNEVRTSGGYWQTEIHRYGTPHGVIYSQDPIKVGFVISEEQLR